MCLSNKPAAVTPPPPPPAPPPVLEQIAPKSKSKSSTSAKQKRDGLDKYKTPSAKTQSNKLGGIPKKVGTG